MGVLAKIFGSGNTIDRTVDGIYNGVDKAVFTAQERVEFHQKFLALYEPFKIAQRLLALIFCTPYAIAWLTTFVCSFFVDVAVQLTLLTGDIATIVGVICGFYFGGGAIEGIVRGVRAKS